MRMTTMQQNGATKLNNGLLSPLKEVLLEIQVNKLINDYLFSSGDDGKATTLNDGNEPLGLKENTTMSMPGHMPLAMLQQNVGNVPCGKPAMVLNVCHNESPHSPHSLACTEGISIIVNEQEIGSSNVPILQPINAAFEASSVNISMEREGNRVNSSSQLSRMDTFPCKSKVQVPWGAACEADTEVKPSCRKPPRPPRPPMSSNELGPGLTRCSSDTGLLLQSTRRAKLERRRKVTAASSTNTSIWALIFTLCFAVVIIAQGFWSEGSQVLAVSGSNASSPTDTYMIINILAVPQEVKRVGVKGREGSTDGGAALASLIH